MDSGNGLNAKGTDNDNFGNLVKGKTDERVANAWGGYFDAGDWDRRIQHLDARRLLLELAELFPDYVGAVTLNSPKHPLVVDAFVMGWAPPPGITIYGPNDFAGVPGYFTLKLLEPVMYPAPLRWPVMDFYVDIFLFPAVTEFTVMETLGPKTYVWGNLAARKRPL